MPNLSGPVCPFPKLKADDHLTDHFGLVTDFLSECWTKVATHDTSI